MSAHLNPTPTKKSDAPPSSSPGRGQATAPSRGMAASSAGGFDQQEAFLVPGGPGDSALVPRGAGEKDGPEKEREKDGREKEPDDAPPPSQRASAGPGGGQLDLAGLDAVARSQADWFRMIPRPQRVPLVALLEWARSTEGARSACRTFGIGDLTLHLVPGGQFDYGAAEHLAAYSRARTRQTVPCPAAASVAEAVAMGEHVVLLEDGLDLDRARLAKVFDAESFHALFERDLTARFVAFLRAQGVTLEAPRGQEVRSFLKLIDEDGEPEKVDAEVRDRARHLHRFSAATLRRIERDRGDDGRRVVLVVQAGADHNGATVRGNPLEHLAATLPGHLRLVLVQGQDGLAGARRYIDELGDEQVAQVILAGHGTSRTIDFGPRTGAPDRLDLSHDAGEKDEASDSDAWVDALLPKLERGARVGLNACFTASHAWPRPRARDDDETMAQRMAEHLARHRPLATTLRDRLASKDAKVIGSRGLLPRSAELWDEKHAQVDVIDPRQPDNGGSAEAYATTSLEPKGAWRALLEVWAGDDAERTAFQRVVTCRLEAPPGLDSVDGRLLHLQMQLVSEQRAWTSVMHLMELQRLAEGAVHTYALFNVRKAARLLVPGLRDFAAHAELLLNDPGVTATPETLLRTANVLCKHYPPAFERMLAALAECDLATASRMLDLSPALVPLERVFDASPSDAGFVLALVCAREELSAWIGPAFAYLAQMREPDGGFAPALANRVGLEPAEEHFLLGQMEAYLGEPRPNLTCDGSPEPDVYVRPMTALWTVATESTLHARPDGEPTGELLAPGRTVHVIGSIEERDLYAIEHRNGVRFVASSAFTPAEGA